MDQSDSSLVTHSGLELTLVCSCRWSYILPRNSLSLSLSLYGVQFPEKVSTEYIFLLLSPTEYVSLQLSLSTEYIFLENSTEYIFLEHTLSLSLYGVHFPPTLSYGIRFPPTLYGVHLSLSLSLSFFTEYISLQLSLRSTFPSNPLYGLYTEYISLQLSLYGLHLPPTLDGVATFSSLCLCLCLSLSLSVYGVHFCSAELWTEFVAVLNPDASSSAVENWISIGSVY